MTDVFWRELPEFYVDEFSANQSANPAPPGRLLRFDRAGMQVVAAPLITPVSMAYDSATKELFVLELRCSGLLRLEAGAGILPGGEPGGDERGDGGD